MNNILDFEMKNYKKINGGEYEGFSGNVYYKNKKIISVVDKGDGLGEDVTWFTEDTKPIESIVNEIKEFMKDKMKFFDEATDYTIAFNFIFMLSLVCDVKGTYKRNFKKGCEHLVNVKLKNGAYIMIGYGDWNNDYINEIKDRYKNIERINVYHSLDEINMINIYHSIDDIVS